MSIDKNSPIPVYYQLKEDIMKKINSGIWKPGQCIDSERELSDTYSVSRMTVRQALGELVQEGILVREKGKGTFVCEPKVKQKDIMSFSEMVKKMGLNLETKINYFKRMSTPENLEGLFLLDEVYKIDRLRIVEGEVIANEIIYIPCDYCGYIDKEKLQDSFYKVLNEYGYTIDHSEASIQAILMDDYYKKLFKVKDAVPLIKSSSRNITSDGKLLFVEESIYRSDKYLLEVNIFRREGKIKWN
jgi:GntR family transcriptional regulator